MPSMLEEGLNSNEETAPSLESITGVGHPWVPPGKPMKLPMGMGHR